MQGMGITLRDLALACDVDISTVSRALRDDPKVKVATRERVHLEAQRLGYHPNLAARSLAHGRTRTVWFILSSLQSQREQEPAQHASLQMREKGYDLLVALYHGDAEAYRRTQRRLSQGVTDGAIILPGPQDETAAFKPLVERNYPLIFLDRHVEGLPIPVVTSSNSTGVQELMRLCLKGAGHGRQVASGSRSGRDARDVGGARSFVILFDAGNPVEEARRDAALVFVRKRKLPFVHGQVSPDILAQLPEPIGVLASAQYMVQQFLAQHAKELQSRRMCFGVFDEWRGEPYPGEVTFVCVQDFAQMARVAVDQLQAMIDGKKKLRAHKTEVPPATYQTILPTF
jgi:DNA-binding LacI/PurR family transcriptional regulator